MTYDEANTQLEQMVNLVGLGFHPDTPFQEYCDDKGRLLFNRQESIRLNLQLQDIQDAFIDEGKELDEMALYYVRQLMTDDDERSNGPRLKA